MKDFRKLKVWEKSHKLALLIYEITSDFPKTEIYGLTSQIRRAAVSIPLISLKEVDATVMSSFRDS